MSKRTIKTNPWSTICKQIFIKNGCGKTILLRIPTHGKMTVRGLKTRIQSKCLIEVDNQCLTYNGKMLWDDDWLMVESNATMQLSHKLRGGDLIGDITNGFNDAIKDPIEKLWKEIVRGFNQMRDGFECVGKKFESIPFCIFFYVFKVLYYIHIGVFWFVLFLMSQIFFQNSWLADRFMYFIDDVGKGFLLKTLRKFNGMRKVLDRVDCCFHCGC